jgi:predicted alpha/beta superfamily hydrolase
MTGSFARESHPMKSCRSVVLLLATLAVAASGLRAADAAAPAPEFPPHVLRNTQLRTLPRSANGSDYLLYVALPPDYATEKTKRYPVVYVTDGYWDFTLYNGFYGNLIYDKVAPHFIIVGFGYQGTHTNADYDVLRRPDYAPPPEGRADKFLGVVEREIIPFIEKNYRADPAYRVLSGNSLGGCFSLYAMLARPGLFQAHVAASPAVPKALFELEEKFSKGGQKLPARLFMVGGELEARDFVANMKRFNDRLASRHYDGFVFQWRLLDGEKHTGTKAEGYSRGLRFAFAPLAPKD